MNAKTKDGSDRFEQIARSMLGLALLSGVLWALAQGDMGPDLGFGLLALR